MGRKYYDLCFRRDKIVVLKLSIVLEQKLKLYHVDSVSSDRCCSVRLANAVKYVFSANTVLILIQYFLGQISVLNLTEFFIARN